MQTEKLKEKELQEVVQNHFSHNYYLCCILTNDLEKEEYKLAMKELKEKRRMMKYTYKGRDCLLGFLISIVGINIAVKLLRLRKRIGEKRAYGREHRI